jgi:hypothetical protein
MLLLNLEFIPTAGFDEVKFQDGVRNTRATSFVEPLRVRVVPRTPVVAVQLNLSGMVFEMHIYSYLQNLGC